MNGISIALVGCVVGVVHAGCTEDGDGSAPTISELVLIETEVPVGKPTVVGGSFVFADPDGDVGKVGVIVMLPDGALQAPQFAGVRDYVGLTTARVVFGAAVTPPLAGTYSFDVWVIDDADQESNHEMITIEAIP